MTKEELFETLSDIDEDIVAAAQDSEAVTPVIVTAQNIQAAKKRKRRFIVPIAACLAGAVALTAAGAALSKGNLSSVLTSSGNNNYAEYPKYATYVYEGEYYGEDHNYSDGNPMGKMNISNLSYSHCAQYSELVVIGTFVDDAHQLDPVYADQYCLSFNKFRIDYIIKGGETVSVGDEIIIAQDYNYVKDGIIKSKTNLSPMNKGDKWLYCLSPCSGLSYYMPEIYGDAYYTMGDFMGRYSVPGDDNPQSISISHTVDYTDPIRYTNSCKYVRRKLVEYGYVSNSPDIQKIADVYDVETSYNDYLQRFFSVVFDMAEYPDMVFVLNNDGLSTLNSENVFGSYRDYSFDAEKTYLCDLNGDGKREIIAVAKYSNGYIPLYAVLAIDLETGIKYRIDRDRDSYPQYSLRCSNNTLLLQSKDYRSSEWSEEVELTLDMMQEFNP